VARHHAHRLAVSAPDAAWTYLELDQRSSALAGLVLERETKVDEPVALLLEHSAPLIAAILGILKAGRIYTCLLPSHPRDRIRALLEDSGAALLLTDPGNAELARKAAPPGLRIEVIGEAWFDRSSVRQTPVEVRPRSARG
jgi:non-ribosomal peptide synthetase component F